MRQKVNAWILSSGEFDGVVDLDAVVRDPSHPTQLLLNYDSGDHLHPNNAGCRAEGGCDSSRIVPKPLNSIQRMPNLGNRGQTGRAPVFRGMEIGERPVCPQFFNQFCPFTPLRYYDLQK